MWAGWSNGGGDSGGRCRSDRWSQAQTEDTETEDTEETDTQTEAAASLRCRSDNMGLANMNSTIFTCPVALILTLLSGGHLPDTA